MAVTYRLAQAGDALQNPAYRPADVFENEGFGATTPDPSPFLGPLRDDLLQQRHQRLRRRHVRRVARIDLMVTPAGLTLCRMSAVNSHLTVVQLPYDLFSRDITFIRLMQHSRLPATTGSANPGVASCPPPPLPLLAA